MVFTNRDKSLTKTHFNLLLDNYPIINVCSTKFLGIWFDDDLTWKTHINNLAIKLSSYVGIFCRLSSFVPSFVLKLLYYSIIYPHLTYCILIWGNSADYLLKKIFVIQKKFIRFILNSGSYDHTDPLFKKLDILRLHDLYIYYVGIFIFKIKNKLLSLGEHYVSFNNKACYPLRNKGNVQQFYCRTEVRKKFIMFSSVPIWNDLPNDIVSVASLSIFKKLLFNYLIDCVENL